LAGPDSGTASSDSIAPEKPLTPIYTWADARAASDAARLRETFDERAIQQRTGCMLRSFVLARQTSLAASHATKAFSTGGAVGFAGGMDLRGNFRTRQCSHSMASGTGLYHFAQRSWDESWLILPA